MQFILTSSKSRVRDVTVTEHIESVRFTDDGLGFTHRYGGTSDGLLLELLDKDGNVTGNTTIKQADILALALALK